jgi:uncharacterized protein YabE (DUF348 family)
MTEKMKNSLIRYFSVGPKSTFILLLLIMALTISIHSMKKNLVVNIDGKDTSIITYRNDLKTVLLRNNITLGPMDKIQPSIDSSVKDGDKIYIKRAVNVEIAVDGEERKIATTEESVEKLLLSEGIILSDKDRIVPDVTENIIEGMKIAITRVDHKIIKETKSIDFSTEVSKDNNLEKGKSKVIQEGVPGEREISINVVYENGKEVSREVIGDVVTKQPVSKKMVQGNMMLLSYSRGGNPEAYTNVIKVKATAYDPVSSGSKKRPGQEHVEYTATGTVAKRNPGGYSTIAVDPKVIPLGTKVYVEGYGYAIAEDTGGAIKGSKIDVYFNSYKEAINWGVKSVNVYILK